MFTDDFSSYLPHPIEGITEADVLNFFGPKIVADKRMTMYTDDVNQNLTFASRDGDEEMVKILLADSRVDPSFEDNEALYVAAVWGRLHIVKVLLAHPLVDPSAKNNATILMAEKSGHLDVVKLLLLSARVACSEVDHTELVLSLFSGAEMALQICGHKTEIKNKRLQPKLTDLRKEGELFLSTVTQMLQDQGDLPKDVSNCVLGKYITGFAYK
jgi:ankyrin repeat protein